MRRILIGIIAATVLGMIGCSSSDKGTITSPSMVPSVGLNVPSGNEDGCGEGNCRFKATAFGIEPSTWSGPTRPTEVDATGHPGTLTFTFTASYYWGVRLEWDKFNTGDKAHCKITNTSGEPEIVLNSCDKGSMDVFPDPTHSPITYTFVDTKNNPETPSKDLVQQRSADPVTMTTSASIRVTWVPDAGYRDDDPNGPTYTYTGTATGPLNNLQAYGNSPTRCGHGGGAQYNHFDASMTYTPGDTPTLTGHYDATVGEEGRSCVAAVGDFTLSKVGS